MPPVSYLAEFDRREEERSRESRHRSLRSLSSAYERGARDVSPRPDFREDWHISQGGEHRGDYRDPDFYSWRGGSRSARARSAPRGDVIRDTYGTHARFDADHGARGFGGPYYGGGGYSSSRGGSPSARFEPPPPRVAHDIMSTHGTGHFGAAPPPSSGVGYHNGMLVGAGVGGVGGVGAGVGSSSYRPVVPGAHGSMVPSGPPVARGDVEDLADLLLRRKFMRALEEYYSPSVVMSDNGLSERVGKEECRRFRHRFLESVMQWHDVAVRTIIADGDRSVMELLFDITFRSGRRVIQKQALVQTWRDGQIVREISYHMI